MNNSNFIRIVLVSFFLTCIPLTGIHAQIQPSHSHTTSSSSSDWFYPIALGIGAVSGVVVVNVLTSGYVGVLPTSVGVVGVGPIADATAVGLSRVYAIVGVVVGGWLADWVYGNI